MAEVTLRGYQEEAVEWMRSHPRTILGDAQGLGKSFPALEVAGDTKHNLLVCPAYLYDNWVRYIAQYLPGRTIAVVEGDPAQRRTALNKGADFTLLSYDMLARARPPALNAATQRTTYTEILDQKWGTIIFDEAARMRNHRSQAAKNAHWLRGERKLLLTGTPIVRDPSDVFGLLRIVDPKNHRGFWDWVGKWCTTYTDPWSTVVTGVKDPDAFNAMLSQYMLRRRLSDHLPEVPDLVEEEIFVDLPPAAL